jgi:hypothetical protein
MHIPINVAVIIISVSGTEGNYLFEISGLVRRDLVSMGPFYCQIYFLYLVYDGTRSKLSGSEQKSKFDIVKCETCLNISYLHLAFARGILSFGNLCHRLVVVARRLCQTSLVKTYLKKEIRAAGKARSNESAQSRRRRDEPKRRFVSQPGAPRSFMR